MRAAVARALGSPRLPSLERLGKELPVVCPNGVSGLLRRKRFAHVTTLDEGEEVKMARSSCAACMQSTTEAAGRWGLPASSASSSTGRSTSTSRATPTCSTTSPSLGRSTSLLSPSPAGAPRSALGISTPSGRPRRFACCGRGWPSHPLGNPGAVRAGSGSGTPARVRAVRGRARPRRRGPDPRAGGGSRLLATRASTRSQRGVPRGVADSRGSCPPPRAPRAPAPGRLPIGGDESEVTVAVRKARNVTPRDHDAAHDTPGTVVGTTSP